MSNGSLASKTAEAKLQKQIENLKSELQAAENNLQKLREHNGSTSQSPTKQRQVLAKKGYLFKWQDRSIGWTGSKWALRFVELDRGRVSYYGSHSDRAPRYVLSLQGCAVRDDGRKRNKRHHSKHKDPPVDEPGAYFFVFSIYQRPHEDIVEDHDIIPILRFSTPSLAEKNKWIQMISDACEFCETDEYIEEEARRVAEEQKNRLEMQKMSQAMPEAKEGTLPPLYFAAAPLKQQRRPSFSKAPPVFRTETSNPDAEKVETGRKGYPPSRPMHRSAAPSFLSYDAPSQNYRGFFNLGIIILVVSNIRLILGTIRRHGFAFSNLSFDMDDFDRFWDDPWREFPFVSGFCLQVAFVIIAYGIEYLLSRKQLDETLGMTLHHLNAHTALGLPMYIVWNLIDRPSTGAILLFHATITWMKLISYFHANEDYRQASRSFEGPQDPSLALVENLDAADSKIAYPSNITLKNIMYFWVAPTLTYQIAFPKFPKVRVLKIVGILMRMIICIAIFTFLVAQVISPTLENLVKDLEANQGTYTSGILAEYWLRLAIANTYLWLLMFYFYFHLYLNLIAEILRFGDRVFYEDWWNSASVSAYWRLWNKPVHYWLARHIYFPCLRMKMPKIAATFVVFLLSAILHEVLVSVPFHMIRPWSFIGMLSQLPLVLITKALHKAYPSSSAGNFVFWLSFCIVGQPMAVLLYTVDYKYSQDSALGLVPEIDQMCRVMFRGKCLLS